MSDTEIKRNRLFSRFYSSYVDIVGQMQTMPFSADVKSLMIQYQYLSFVIAKEAFSSLTAEAIDSIELEEEANESNDQ